MLKNFKYFVNSVILVIIFLFNQHVMSKTKILADPNKNKINNMEIQLSDNCIKKDSIGRIENTNLGLLIAKCSNQNLIIMSKSVDNEQKKVIVHELAVRELKKGESLRLSGHFCYLGKKIENRIDFIGIFNGWKQTSAMTKKNGIIVDGWLINIKNEKIEPVSAKQINEISCLDESGGNE